MLQILPRQARTLQIARFDALSVRLRVMAAQILPCRQLAASDVAWSRWWDHVLATRTEVHATTSRTLAAHATFSLWLGHRYFRDPRWGWFQELSGAPPDGLDLRAMDVELADLLDIATLTMELAAGPNHAVHLDTMRRVADLGTRLAAGETPEWSPDIGLRAMTWLRPDVHEQLAPGAADRILASVQAVSKDLQQARSLCLPLLILATAFGIEAWTDPALPALCCTRQELQALTCAQLGQRMHQQACISADQYTLRTVA